MNKQDTRQKTKKTAPIVEARQRGQCHRQILLFPLYLPASLATPYATICWLCHTHKHTHTHTHSHGGIYFYVIESTWVWPAAGKCNHKMYHYIKFTLLKCLWKYATEYATRRGRHTHTHTHEFN